MIKIEYPTDIVKFKEEYLKILLCSEEDIKKIESDYSNIENVDINNEINQLEAQWNSIKSGVSSPALSSLSVKNILTSPFKELLEICIVFIKIVSDINDELLSSINIKEIAYSQNETAIRTPTTPKNTKKNLRHNNNKIKDEIEKLNKLSKQLLKGQYEDLANSSYIIHKKTELDFIIRIKNMFDYGNKNSHQSKYSSRIAQFFILNKERLNISTCFYCNMSYISVLQIKNEDGTNKREFDIDHLLTKSLYPIVSLSLFNFVPSCKTCNQTIKHTKELLTIEISGIKDSLGNVLSINDADRCSPTSPNYKFVDNVQFKTIWKKGTPVLPPMINNKNSFEFDFNISDKIYENEISLLGIKSRYDFHIVEAMRLHELQMKYPQSHLEELAKTIYSDPLKADWVREDIFGESFMQNENRAFAKMHKDIMSEYDKSK